MSEALPVELWVLIVHDALCYESYASLMLVCKQWHTWTAESHTARDVRMVSMMFVHRLYSRMYLRAHAVLQNDGERCHTAVELCPVARKMKLERPKCSYVICVYRDERCKIGDCYRHDQTYADIWTSMLERMRLILSHREAWRLLNVQALVSDAEMCSRVSTRLGVSAHVLTWSRDDGFRLDCPPQWLDFCRQIRHKVSQIESAIAQRTSCRSQSRFGS